VHAVSFDTQAYFKRQIEECCELARHAINADDQAFWKQVAGRWEEQLREAQHADHANNNTHTQSEF
jgi:hypothetical protein